MITLFLILKLIKYMYLYKVIGPQSSLGIRFCKIIIGADQIAEIVVADLRICLTLDRAILRSPPTV